MTEENNGNEKETKNLESQVENIDTTAESSEENQIKESEENLSPEEINWRKFREQREKDRREKEEALRIAQEKEEQISAYKAALEQVMEKENTNNLSQEQQDKIIEDLIDEDIPTGADIKGFVNRVVPKIVESVLNNNQQKEREERERREVQEMPNRLKKEYNDFHDIVNKENLDYLEYHYPEVSEALGVMQNNFDKWAKIYKTVKKLVPNQGSNDLNRIEKNSQKPQSVSQSSYNTSGERGYSKRLTDEEKAANYQRLRDLARGL